MGGNPVRSYLYLLKISIKQKIKKLKEKSKEMKYESVILSVTTCRLLPKN